MSTEQNKALFRRFIDEVINQGNLAVIDEGIAADFIEHEVLPPGIPAGREGVKAIFGMLRAAFPDLQSTVEQEIAEGDKVVAVQTWRGTHQGPFMDIPATGKQVKFGAIDVVRFSDGKVVEHWGLLDMMALMQQLGVVPPPE